MSSYLPQIPAEHLDTFDPIGKLAMALVLFSIGCHFPLVRFRRILRRVLRLSAGEIGLTFALVTVGVHLAGMPWSGALLLGALAIATAPATTILVLRENESEGPVTEYATALVVFNNLAAVVAFELLLLFVHLTDANTTISMADELSRLAQDLAGSLALGVAAGLLLSYAAALLSASRLVLLVAVSSLLLGVCHMTQIPYLLRFWRWARRSRVHRIGLANWSKNSTGLPGWSALCSS